MAEVCLRPFEKLLEILSSSQAKIYLINVLTKLKTTTQIARFTIKHPSVGKKKKKKATQLDTCMVRTDGRKLLRVFSFLYLSQYVSVRARKPLKEQ